MIKIHNNEPSPNNVIFNLQQHIDYLNGQLAYHKNENNAQATKIVELNNVTQRIEKENADLKGNLDNLNEKMKKYVEDATTMKTNYLNTQYMGQRSNPLLQIEGDIFDKYQSQPTNTVPLSRMTSSNTSVGNLGNRVSASIYDMVDNKNQIEQQFDSIQSMMEELNNLLSAKNQMLRTLSKQTKCGLESIVKKHDKIAMRVGNVLDGRKLNNNNNSSATADELKYKNKISKLEKKLLKVKR
jgi:DNA repair exonuclease SbcCD ATPase subunit